MFFLALETEEWDDPGYPSYLPKVGRERTCLSLRSLPTQHKVRP